MPAAQSANSYQQRLPLTHSYRRAILTGRHDWASAARSPPRPGTPEPEAEAIAILDVGLQSATLDLLPKLPAPAAADAPVATLQPYAAMRQPEPRGKAKPKPNKAAGRGCCAAAPAR